MVFFKDIKKKANEIADSATKWGEQAIEDVSKITSETTKNVSDLATDIKENVLQKGEQLRQSYENGTLKEDIGESLTNVGDLAVSFGKTITGISAYEARKESQELKKEADEILARTEKHIDEVVFWLIIEWKHSE